jgi:GNAT superfamily N-acetyltransferase
MQVRSDHRTRGFGAAIVTVLAQAAREQGAAGMYLQVEEVDEQARRLYRRCGFVESHGYHHRVAPSGAPERQA